MANSISLSVVRQSGSNLPTPVATTVLVDSIQSVSSLPGGRTGGDSRINSLVVVQSQRYNPGSAVNLEVTQTPTQINAAINAPLA